MKAKDRKVIELEQLPIVRERFCWECRFIRFSTSSSGYSEETPGWDFELDCTRQYWELDTENDNESIMGRYLALAKRCPDFDDGAEAANR